MRYFEIICESNDTDLSYAELLAKYPTIANDLKDLGEWMRTDPLQMRYKLTFEPMSKFEKEAADMLGTYDEFPKDAKRTKKIMKLLKAGEQQLPIFYDTASHFIMEGRHRIVAFYLLKLPTVPVVTVN